jgi:hypothetical protein
MVGMERNVVHLDTAEKLKAARFPQEMFMAWVKFEAFDEWKLGPKPADTLHIAAPTAQEIADQLPLSYNDADLILGRMDMSHIESAETDWTAWYWDVRKDTTDLGASAPTMAEALALLWLKLKDVDVGGISYEGSLEQQIDEWP